ncbi:sulfide/dihydroorotate dehydrogenase-like FAD/NAD-binding protein, partial [Lawsonibacter sp. NSJ-52]|nr:sulfide/dihydroorotate dehydrogenase-like FAD/NAD-binding protein [Lawsonibacter faecis]MBC5738369.1 sulfide/dihydroorotate dehydrogenase-like FAD/NAD-binding protein [Lawsonibacter faecis]
MAKVLRKAELNSSVTLLEVEAAKIAKKALPGQFIILRID